MKEVSKSIFTLVILVAISNGCKSQQAIKPESTEPEYIEETSEEKIARAQIALKRADDQSTPCARIAEYGEVLKYFSDTPQAKFAEKKKRQDESKIVSVLKKQKPIFLKSLPKTAASLDAVESAFRYVEEIRGQLNAITNECQAPAITAAADEIRRGLDNAESRLLADREKRHGY